MPFSYFSLNGEIRPLQEAKIELSNLEYAYGFGVYESMKIRKERLYFLKQHIERLLKSAEIIELNHTFSEEGLKNWVEEFSEAIKKQDCNLKIMLIGNPKPEAVKLYIIPLNPLFPDRKLYKKGARLTSFEYERWKPGAKSLNMLPSYYYYTKAKKEGCYDCLFVNQNQEILEGSRTNFFAIKEKTLYSPPLDKILEGVTFQTVTHVAKQNGFDLTHQTIPLSTLNQYDGAFLTSTSSKIIPITEIDDFHYSEISPEIKELMKKYDHFLDYSNGVFAL
jgi:branched-subunit amino acid aminotransferase/4-amino-4-deoxychorismate lyase